MELNDENPTINIKLDPEVDDVINWIDEANAIINDVKRHVDEIKISDILSNTEGSIYLNIRTIEGNAYCVKVSGIGFRIVGNTYDTININFDESNSNLLDEMEGTKNNENNDDEAKETFETPYALLDKISPRYVESFGNQLCKQLLQLQQMKLEFNEEDEKQQQNNSNNDKMRKISQ